MNAAHCLARRVNILSRAEPKADFAQPTNQLPLPEGEATDSVV